MHSSMNRAMLRWGWLCAWVVASGAFGADNRVDFQRDIRPLLSDRCFRCHGPDDRERATDLRLDIRQKAYGELESGVRAIVPGKPEASELYRRIASDDPDERMPPADSGKSLSPDEIEKIRLWIAQGAQWQDHWAFVPAKRPPVPEVKRRGWARNPIDRFILARLEEEGLQPSPEADRITLIRRVTYDLTGLPPTPEEVDAFLADTSPDAYERLVERLLHSPRYGEHMARYWLDVARYGDTHGLHLDNYREIWPYRDWVIGAFNRNLPFDQFTIEQLAGDLLPEPTLDQLVATGFNRCNVTTSEGGSIAEEFRVRYAIERVETIGTVWMGLTVGCAQCHEHKYDPISQTEFYQLFAFYNNTADNAMDGNAKDPPPVVRVPTEAQKRRQSELQTRIAELQRRIRDELAKIEYTDPLPADQPVKLEPTEHVWIDDDLPAGASPVASGDGPKQWKWVEAPEHPVHSGKRATTRTAKGLSQHYFTGASPGLKVGAGDRLFAWVWIDAENPPREIMLQFNDGTWEHRAFWGEDLIGWGRPNTSSRRRVGDLPEAGRWVRLEVAAEDVGLKPGATLNGWAFTQFGGTVYWDTAGIVSLTAQPDTEFKSLRRWIHVQRSIKKPDLPKPVVEALRADPAKRTAQQTKRLRDYFLSNVYPESRKRLAPLQNQLQTARNELTQLNNSIPTTLIMRDRPQPRDCFVLIRGAYDKKGDKVEAGVPAFLPPLARSKDKPANRLDLARWLVDGRHPLTARVTVNRFWQQYFGTGIVKTAEDFGSQGEWPSHPKLLDWLAVEFVESGWDIKHMQRLIVTSAAYRQSAAVTPELHKRDPENRLLARGPRFRMDAEMIRDTALAVSGLLVEHIGGPSVKPYQPEGLWEAVGYTDSNTAKFVQDHGTKLYRRSMYTFWKRTSPPPSLATFDAPSRESCTARRSRTNTPLQALVLLNDVQFVEAARHLAERMLREGGNTPEARLAYGFRLVTGRQPRSDEAAILLDTLQAHLKDFRNNPEAAQKLLSVGESPRDASLPAVEHAAWTMIGNLLLNLDETITKG